jgi:8-oxo-dGTP pyrophosphatase MutT (NUDIX family)
VVLVDDAHVALIRRRRGGQVYHVFPGGGVELDETDELAAIREAHEELGLHVEIIRLIGTVTYGTSTQMYFEVRATGGAFGTGSGAEMSSSAESDLGSYEPIWLSVNELANVDVRPRALASMLANGSASHLPFAIVEA